MEPLEYSTLSKPKMFGGLGFLTRIFEILDTSDDTKGLKIAVSVLGNKKLLHCNNAFKQFVGCKMAGLQEKGWDHWYEHICPKEVLRIKNRIRNFCSNSFDQKSITMRYHVFNGVDDYIFLRHEMVLHRMENHTLSLSYFFDVSEKERIEHCLQQKRQRVTDEPNMIAQISPREEEVLRLVADGHSSKQIANMLYISNHTAISHRKHLIEKFGVKNTAQLIKKASRLIEL